MASMTFLQIVQRAYQEAGLVGAGPVSVLNQTGRNRDMVNWVLEAHEEIQGLRYDWSFDWAQLIDGSLSAGDDTYTPTADFGIVGGVRDFVRTPGASYSYPTASGVNARAFLQFLEWEQFRGLNVPVVPGQPVVFTLKPDGNVAYYPRPDRAITAVHEYYRNAEVLAANADVPRMPAWSHMAIAWKAVMIACGKTKDFARHDTAEENYEAIKMRMLIECTPRVVAGGPLA